MFQDPCSCQDLHLNEYDKWTAWGNGTDQCAKQIITVDHRESFLTLEQFHMKVKSHRQDDMDFIALRSVMDASSPKRRSQQFAAFPLGTQ